MGDLVYGRHAVFHLIKSGRRSVSKLHILKGSELIDDPVIGLARKKNIRLEQNDRPFFTKLENATHQGILAETEPYPFQPIETFFSKKSILLCDGIQDPQNLGAICRSAFLLGVEGVVVLEHRSVSITPGVCKAAAGAVEYLSIAKVSSLPKILNLLKENKFWVYGGDQEGVQSVYQEKFPEKTAVVIGGEGKGLSRLVRERCDIIVKIPMGRSEIGSFSASTSAALILSEIFRQKLQDSSGNP